MNVKKNKKIGDLAKYIDIAIKQEKNLNQDVHSALGRITCNIGSIIHAIREDQGVR